MAAERKRRRDADGSNKRESLASIAASGSSSNSSATTTAAAAPASLAAGPRNLDCGVYLEGVPFTATEADIRHFFRECGTIAEVRAPTFQDSGRLRGYAHVYFASKAAAAKALELDGRYIGERFISVQPPRPESEGREEALALASRPRPTGCSTLFAKGLPYNTDEAAVKAAFTRFGEVASVRLPRWQHTGRLKGHGYVQFEVAFAAEAAMKEYRVAADKGAPFSISGRPVSLDWESGVPRQSFKTSTGQPFFKTEEGEPVKRLAGKLHAKSAAAAAAAASSAASAPSASSGHVVGSERSRSKKRPAPAAAAAAEEEGDSRRRTRARRSDDNDDDGDSDS